MSRRPRLRSVRTKLALVFFAIIAAAFGVLYFIVVPPLESNLEQRQLDDIARRRAGRAAALQGEDRETDLQQKQFDERVRAVRRPPDARVTLLGGWTRRASSIAVRLAHPEEDPRRGSLARQAVDSGRVVEQVATTDGQAVAQVAQPFGPRDRRNAVVLYSRDLEDVAEAVHWSATAC